MLSGNTLSKMLGIYKTTVETEVFFVMLQKSTYNYLKTKSSGKYLGL